MIENDGLKLFFAATLRHQINWFSTRFSMYKNHLHIIEMSFVVEQQWEKNIIYESRKGSFPKLQTMRVSFILNQKYTNLKLWEKKLAFKWEKGFDSWSYKKLQSRSSRSLEEKVANEERWSFFIVSLSLPPPQKFLSNVFENYHNFLCIFLKNPLKFDDLITQSHA